MKKLVLMLMTSLFLFATQNIDGEKPIMYQINGIKDDFLFRMEQVSFVDIGIASCDIYTQGNAHPIPAMKSTCYKIKEKFKVIVIE